MDVSLLRQGKKHLHKAKLQLQKIAGKDKKSSGAGQS